MFYKLPQEQAEVFSKPTPYYDDTRVKLARDIVAKGDQKAVDKSAEALAKTINKLTESGASQTYCLESMVECANALIALGKPSTDHVLWVLNQQKDRGLYLFSQRAQLLLYEVLRNLHDIRAIDKIKTIMSSTKKHDMFVDRAAKETISFLEVLESSGLGKFM